MTSTPYNQSGDYIPRTDHGFADWANAFARLTGEDPQRFALTQAEADEIALWADRFVSAFQVAQQPSSRTTGIVRAKKDLRSTVERILRQYAQQIKKTRGITFQDLAELGLHVDDQTKTPIGAPGSSPLLNIMMAKSLAHIIRYRDRNTPSARRKPQGVTLIQIFANVGDAIDCDMRAARSVGDYGRQPIRIEWPPDCVGKTVTYFGRWMTKKGLKGPWSLPVYMTVAGGGPVGGVAEPVRGAVRFSRPVSSAGGDQMRRAA